MVFRVNLQVEIKEASTAPIATAEKPGTPFKPQKRAPTVRVVDPSDDELDQLQGNSSEAVLKRHLMAVAAEVLQVLSAVPKHAAVVVAQGGLLAASKALEWDLSPEINIACAMMVHTLAAADPAYLQVV
jgi:hypothetical protein